MDLGDDVDAVDHERRVARHAQRDVEHGAILGDVDVLAAEHRVAPRRDPRSAASREQQLDRLGGDPVLGEVGMDAGRLEREPLDPTGISGEQVAEMPLADVVEVMRERAPGGAVRERAGIHGGTGACAPGLVDSMTLEARTREGAMATDSPMQLGMVGLGRMGANIVRRLDARRPSVRGYRRQPGRGPALADEGDDRRRLARGARREARRRRGPSG